MREKKGKREKRKNPAKATARGKRGREAEQPE